MTGYAKDACSAPQWCKLVCMKRETVKKNKAQVARRKPSSAAVYRSNRAGHTPSAIRQSVTIPGDLAELIERKKQQDESISKVLVRYARLGIAEEARARVRLREVVRKIQAAPSEAAAEAYVDELTEGLFGPQRQGRA